LLKQFGEDYKAQQKADLMAEVRTLQASEPRMSFDEAWDRAMAANPELRSGEEVPRE
jgi:hypothetical protein